jgi:hypothetical protein
VDHVADPVGGLHTGLAAIAVICLPFCRLRRALFFVALPLSVCLSVCLSAYLRTDPAPLQPRDHRRSLRVRRGGSGGRRIVQAGGVVRGAVASEGDCGLGVQWGGVSGMLCALM